MSMQSRALKSGRCYTFARRVLAVLLALALPVAYTPGLAYASELLVSSEGGSFTTAEGWTLSYEFADEDAGEIAITGVTGHSGDEYGMDIPAVVELSSSTTATVVALEAYALCSSAMSGGANEYATLITSLSLPSTLESIGNYGLYGCSSITTLELPEGVETLGLRCCMGMSALESVSLPSSLAYLPRLCFSGCSALTGVQFADGMTLEYLGAGAFTNCSSLAEIEIPALVGDTVEWETVNSSKDTTASYRVGTRLFNNCTSLSSVVFLGGGDGSSYFTSSPGGVNSTRYPFEAVNAENPFTVVNYNRGSSPSSSDSNMTYYVTVNYYSDGEVAEADTGNTQFEYQEVWESGTSIYDIVFGTVTDADGEELGPYETSGELPELADGMVWMVGENAMSSASATLGDGIVVYPTDGSESNLTGGWVQIEGGTVYLYDCYSVEETDDDGNVTSTVWGTPDFSGISVYSANGELVDESLYTLVFLEPTVEVISSMNVKTYSYSQISGEGDWAEGDYNVYAVSNTPGSDGEFTTTGVEYSLSDTGYMGSDFEAAQYVAAAASVTSAYTTTTDRNYNLAYTEWQTTSSMSTSPTFTVVCSADNWRYALIANSLAAVGDGFLIMTDGEDTHDYAYAALYNKKADVVQIVGEDDEIGQTMLDKVDLYASTYSATTNQFPLQGTTVSSADEMALQVYDSIATYGEETYGEGVVWGSTAIVASSEKAPNIATIAQYAYETNAPVFFTDDEGELGDETLSALADGGFSQVLVAGSEAYVSAEVCAAIENACGIAPQRIASEESVYASGMAMLELLEADCPDAISTDNVVLSSADDLATVIVASQYAAITGSSLLVAAASVDVKAAESYLYEYRQNASDVFMTGDFSGMDAEAVERIASVWSEDGPMSTDVETGDGVERLGVLYTVSSANQVTCAGLFESTMRAVDIGAVEVDGVTYDVQKVPAGLLAGDTYVQTLEVDAASIGVSAFAGCTALTSASATATSIGASAFQGCSALTSATLSATALTSIGASSFQGCGKLASASIASTALTTVGSKAFYGCKALKSISLKSTKLKSIGASAFQGCSALAKATISSAVLTSVGASAFQGCSKLASVSIASTALTSMGSKAFYGCKKLKTLNLKSKKLKTIGASALQGCSDLTKLTLASTKLTKIGSKAFYGCKALKSVSLKSKKLKTIGASAFQGCSKLASVSIASTALTSVGAKAFYGCKKLKTLSLKSKKLKTIGVSAFQGCSTLTKLTVSSTKLNKIGSKAFYGCKKLKTLTLKSKKLKKVGAKAFAGVKASVVVKVPTAKVASYKKLFAKRGLARKAKVKKV